MISRHLRITFWCLIAAILAMALWLFHVHQRERDRLHSLADDTPIDAPYTDAEPITLDLANDSDGSITATTRQLALPTEVTARARALLDHLVADYATPGSPHPLPSGAAVDGVFLLPLPVVGYQVDPDAQPTPDHIPTVPVAPPSSTCAAASSTPTPPASKSKPSPSSPSWARSTPTSPRSSRSASS
jgi:hypothetical protein